MLITESVFAVFLIHAISVIVYAPVMLADTEWMSTAACVHSGGIASAVQMHCSWIFNFERKYWENIRVVLFSCYSSA